jgi:hypothetical protein
VLRLISATAILASLLVGSGCIRIKSDPVRVEPIHVTVDVNIRVQKELDNFFDDLDSADSTIKNDKK